MLADPPAIGQATQRIEPGLVEQLTEIARNYRGSVYLAPNDYDGKVILTKLEKRKILDQFDERAIRAFITGQR